MNWGISHAHLGQGFGWFVFSNLGNRNVAIFRSFAIWDFYLRDHVSPLRCSFRTQGVLLSLKSRDAAPHLLLVTHSVLWHLGHTIRTLLWRQNDWFPNRQPPPHPWQLRKPMNIPSEHALERKHFLLTFQTLNWCRDFQVTRAHALCVPYRWYFTCHFLSLLGIAQHFSAFLTFQAQLSDLGDSCELAQHLWFLCMQRNTISMTARVS